MQTPINVNDVDIAELIHSLADPAILVGTDRVIVTANSAINELFGWGESGLTGQLLDVLIPSAISDSHPDWVQAFFARPASRSMSENPMIEGVRKNGERVQVDISLTPVQQQGEKMALAIVHDTSRTAERYSQRIAELTALTAISNLVKSELDALDIIEKLARQVRNLIPYDRFVVVTFDKEKALAKDWFIAGEKTESDKPWHEYHLSPDQVTEYLNLRDPFIVRSSAEHTLLSSMEANIARFKEGYRTLLCVPMIWGGEILGVINFRSKSASAYNDETLQIATQVSTVAASTIGRSKMVIAQTQSDHQRATITNISHGVSQANDVRRIFDSIALQIDEIIPIDRIVLSSLNSEKTGYSVEAAWGPSDERMSPGIFRALSGTATELAVLAGAPVILSKNQIESITAHNRPDGDDPSPMKSWIVAPLELRGEAIGVIHFRTFDPDVYDRSHLDYAQQLAAIFTTTIENYSHARDNERERHIRSSVVQLNRRAIEGASLDVLADTAGSLLSQFIEFDRFSAVAIDVEKSETTVLYQTGVEVSGGGASSKLSYSGMAAGGTSQLGDVSALPSPWSDRLHKAGLHSWMYMAIGGESGNPIGAIWISSKRKSAFNARDLEIVERLGGVLAPVFHANALEQAREQLEGERERSQSLATQTAILESDARAKSEFISSISHEFKTPLTSVVAFSSLLRRDDSLSERQHKQLDLIQNNAWRLEKMIDDLLHVASADAGRLSFDIQEVNVAAMAKEVSDGLIPVAKSAGKRLVWRSSQVQNFAAVDPVRYAQAVQNIVSNAVKYSPIGTGITASLCEIDGSIELLVRNKGGLSQQESEQAFSRFTRLDNEVTRSTPGTGLGLSITREILDEMGGTISLESNGHCVEARIRVPIFTE